ncbi:MAG: HAMP domain-containing sensor histidine kinase [Cyanobacteria bacterium J06648_16]
MLFFASASLSSIGYSEYGGGQWGRDVDTFWAGLGMGLLLGLLALWVSQYRANRRLQVLLKRIQQHSASPHMSYESQIASAIATQGQSLDRLSDQVTNFRQILRQAPVGYLYVDDENRLLGCNLKAQSFLDFNQVDYDPPRLLLAIARSYELDQLIEDTREQQQLCQREWVFYSISPDPSNVSERPAHPLRGYGVPLQRGHVAIFLENRQEAVALMQQRDRWTSDVTHELKTPLTSIRLVAETLRNRVDDSLTSWVDRLLSEVMRLSHLVDDVLNLNQLDQPLPKIGEPDATNLIPLIYQAWQNVMPLAELKSVQLQYSGPDQHILKLHGELIYRLLINLLDNAIKYSPANAAVQVRVTTDALPTEPQSRAVLIEVIDSGPGFLDKDLPFVFDRFYRSDLARSRSKTAKGNSSTGLGLSIVRKIVTLHKGHIEAQNHPETSGAWLKVWLPESLRNLTTDTCL